MVAVGDRVHHLARPLEAGTVTAVGKTWCLGLHEFPGVDVEWPKETASKTHPLYNIVTCTSSCDGHRS